MNHVYETPRDYYTILMTTDYAGPHSSLQIPMVITTPWSIDDGFPWRNFDPYDSPDDGYTEEQPDIAPDEL